MIGAASSIQSFAHYFHDVTVSRLRPYATAPYPCSRLSAPGLHETLLHLHHIGDDGRVDFLLALLAMNLSGLYRQFGILSFVRYAETYFGCSPFQTYHSLDLATALHRLPLCQQWYREGKISWPKLNSIIGVAVAETEALLLQFAASHSLAEIREEIRRRAAEETRGYSVFDFTFPGGYGSLPSEGVYA